MNGHGDLFYTIISLVGGFLTTGFFVKYGPTISRRARRKSVGEHDKVVASLQRSIQKRDRSIEYLDRKLDKVNHKSERLLTINEKLRLQNELEKQRIQYLEKQLKES